MRKLSLEDEEHLTFLGMDVASMWSIFSSVMNACYKHIEIWRVTSYYSRLSHVGTFLLVVNDIFLVEWGYRQDLALILLQ